MTSLLIKLFVKNYSDTKSIDARNRYGNLGSAVGICVNILLSFVKIVIGLVGGILSITADGLNNLADAGSSVSKFFFIGCHLAYKKEKR